MNMNTGCRSAVMPLLRMVMAALLTGAPVAAVAQVTSGSVAGVVVDAQGGVIPGATVVLLSTRLGIRSAPVVTSGLGEFVFPIVAPGVYTVEVSMPGFSLLNHEGISVSPGDRVALGMLTLVVGGATESISVSADSRVQTIQAASGERSFTVSSTQMENLPIANRTFQSFAALAPGVDGVQRVGGGGMTNFMMDGVVNMDPGNNGPALTVSAETMDEVKVLTSGYQAEYGRASGLQITGVTKSGSNYFKGSVYDIERNSDWNANSRVNILNGDPKPVARQRDWGFTIGGPIGRPGGNNKLFFFFAQEFNPRAVGGNVVRYRMPTALERQGDFSQTYDNNGVLYPFIKDPLLPGACNATNQSGCFADGGVLGRIPADRLYPTGLAILRWWPMPTIENASGLAYNFELQRPVEKALGYAPVLKIDYQPYQSLRLSFKFNAFGQRNQTFVGNLPGFTDTRQSKPVVPVFLVSGTYTLSPSTVIEATYGAPRYQQEGCAFAVLQGSPSPAFCTAAIAQSPLSNKEASGFGNLPMIYPDALVIDPRYHARYIFELMNPPYWDGVRLLRPPTFQFGSRVTNVPPGIPFPGFFQKGGTNDISVSVTKILGRHTVKAGYYFQGELHTRNGGADSFGTINFGQDPVGTNPFDTSFGYSNAAIGAFSSYSQGSKYLEGRFVYYQNDAYIQDNWRVNNRLTLDYGLRIVNQGPYHDALTQTMNFLPDRWSASEAPVLYEPGCVGAPPCSGANRQAVDPRSGQLQGPGSTVLIGSIVPGSGSSTNGLFRAGAEIVHTNYKWPLLAYAPRFGFAYDVSGSRRTIIRGAAGLYFDRPSANDAGTYQMIGNPPVSESVAMRYSTLQTLGATGLQVRGVPALQSNQYESPLPASAQFNVGIQRALPWATTVDVSYVGQHAYNTIQNVNINSLDIGIAFQPEAQDPTGGASLASTSPDLLRSFRGFNTITHRLYNGWRTYHSVQISIDRRFQNGVSFGFNDTIGLYDRGKITPRLQHDGPGAFTIRSDNDQAQALLGNNFPTRHLMKANVVWDMPDLRGSGGVLGAVAALVNDWQLSGVWMGRTGAAYSVGFSYQNGGGNVNLTGSPDYAARVLIVGDPGAGCSSNVYRQFNTGAFQGPPVGSVGLESGNGYLKGCFQSTLDLSIARNIRLPAARNVQLRVDMFNAPNNAIITNRNTTMNLNSPSDPTTITNLPYDANGNLIESRTLPRGAGFGVATNYSAPRAIQAQIRFQF